MRPARADRRAPHHIGRQWQRSCHPAGKHCQRAFRDPSSAGGRFSPSSSGPVAIRDEARLCARSLLRAGTDASSASSELFVIQCLTIAWRVRNLLRARRLPAQYVWRRVRPHGFRGILGRRRTGRVESEAINRLLVVDDEAAQVEALCRTLGDEGYSVEGFTDTGAALDALRAGSFDIVLTDLTMPVMDGIAFLNAAREIDPGLAGIVMTGHGSIATAVEAMKAGAIDYILKPFDLRVILRVLARTQAMLRLRRENAALLERLSLRTVELETANRELEAFSYSVSHDLRAPVRTIDGLLNVIQEDFGADVPAEARQHIEAASA